MDRINTGTKAENLFGAGKHGWKNSISGLGVTATEFNAEWCNGVQEELLSIIEGAGIPPDIAVRTQVRQAIKRLAGGNVTSVYSVASPFALAADHAGMVLVDASAGNVVINLPPAAVVVGLPYFFRRIDATANTVTVNRAGADTIDEGGTSFSLGSKAVRQLRSDGVSGWRSLTGVPPATQQDVSASRSSDVTYYNTKGGDVEVSNQVTSNVGVANSVFLYIGGHQVASVYLPAFAGGQSAVTVFGVVRPGESYSSSYVGATGVWNERR